MTPRSRLGGIRSLAVGTVEGHCQDGDASTVPGV